MLKDQGRPAAKVRRVATSPVGLAAEIPDTRWRRIQPDRFDAVPTQAYRRRKWDSRLIRELHKTSSPVRVKEFSECGNRGFDDIRRKRTKRQSGHNNSFRWQVLKDRSVRMECAADHMRLWKSPSQFGGQLISEFEYDQPR